MVSIGDHRQEMVQQRRNVLRTLAQRGQVDPHDVQAMIEVAAEFSQPDHVRQVLVRSGQKARIDLHRHRLAHGHYFMLLQHAEELGLQGKRKLADFIEKDRSSLRRPEHAEHGLFGARERPAHVAEKLAFKETLADACAIDRNKRPLRAMTLGKQPPGDQLLSRAAFTFNQNAAVGGGHLVHKLQHITNRLGNAHDNGHTASRDLERTHDMLGGSSSWKSDRRARCILQTARFQHISRKEP